VEADELSLRLRSQKLALQYIVKLKSNSGNPTYCSVFEPNYTALFDAKPNIVPTLGLRLRQALSEFCVNLSCIAQRLGHSESLLTISLTEDPLLGSSRGARPAG
jgi:ABC-type enterochelin transport system substrate-binding protein